MRRGFTYLPTSAIWTTSRRVSIRSASSFHSARSARACSIPSFSHTKRRPALPAGQLRYQVHVRHIGQADDSAGVDVGEKGDLLADVGRELIAGATDDDVGMDADSAQLVHEVLGRLRLQLACGIEEGDERDVQVEHVLVTSRRNWRIASRNGSDSCPCRRSEMTTSTGLACATRRIRALISFVMCGITWTVAQNSPRRSLRARSPRSRP